MGSTTTYQIDIPNHLQLADLDVKMLVASQLYEKGKLSAGQAAKVAGISKRSFLEILGKYNVSIFNYSVEELQRDIENV